MRALSATDILRVWESGEAQSPVERALLLLGAAWPEQAREQLEVLDIEQRDAQLWQLRALTFGPRLDARVECPTCGERLEFTLDSDDFNFATTATEHAMEVEGTTLRFRLPNSRDLARAAACDDETAARRSLARCCVIQVERDGATQRDDEGDDLPESLLAALAERLSECAPRADLQLDFACPACGHVWRSGFDIAAFLWAEVVAQARRLLREVDLLARVYGWREADILALSARRRQMYVEMAA